MAQFNDLEPVAGMIAPGVCARWQRMLAHAFEDPAAGLDFTRRLAREQGWTLTEARQAIAEYRRYCWLQCTSTVSLTPSVAVDQVWHLHLTYTQDYWERWCGVALCQPLHHLPSRGGIAQSRLYRAQYAHTLACYEAAFGPPPERWWPGTQARFADARRWRWVDTTQHWVIPRLRLWSRRWSLWTRVWTALRQTAGVTATLLLAALSPLAYGHGWNPYGWDAETFLTVYLLGGLALLVWHVRYVRARLAPGHGHLPTTALSALEWAALAGGPQRLRDVVVTTALQHGAVVLGPDGRLQRGTGEVPVETLELSLAAGQGDGVTRAGLAQVLQPVVARVQARLQALGLQHDPQRLHRVMAWACLPLWLWLAFGASRIVLGLQRGRPVGWLLLMVGVLLVITLVRRYGRAVLTAAGQSALAHAQQQHARLRRAPREAELPLAVALVGTTILAGTAWAQWHRPPGADASGGGGGGDSATSSAADGTSSSDSSEGGGDSGCGGCGGGGD